MSATKVLPALCGACRNPATLTCQGCDNMQYCSANCQERDKAIHGILCGSFKDFQDRPGENFHRAIYFPLNESKPRFVWIEYLKVSDTLMIIPDAVLDRYVPHNAEQIYYFDKDDSLRRQLNHTLRIYRGDVATYQFAPPNQSIASLLEPKYACYWLLPYLVTATKYSNESDGEWCQLYGRMPILAIDLDTTSLGPIVAYLKYQSSLSAAFGHQPYDISVLDIIRGEWD